MMMLMLGTHECKLQVHGHRIHVFLPSLPPANAKFHFVLEAKEDGQK